MTYLRISLCFAFAFAVSSVDADSLITFDDPGLFVAAHSPVDGPNGSEIYNGDRGGATPATRSSSDGWNYGGVEFENSFTAFDGGFTFIQGWARSNVNDVTTPGFGNQYAAISGTGIGGAGFYALGFGSGSSFDLPAGEQAQSVQVTNTTFAALSMQLGDSFAKPFGGDAGSDPDLFEVIFNGHSGLGGSGDLTGSTTFALADYRSVDPSGDYIVTTWQDVDLSALGNARSISIDFTSTDVGSFGINTPLNVAIDNLSTVTAVPEPGSWLALTAAAGWLVRRRRRSQNSVAEGQH